MPDDQTYPLSVILKSRQLYFKEGETVAESLVKVFVNNTRISYEEEKENRRNLRYGIVFIFGTCLFDWLICSV
jgi:hypothetical protein